jgi:hypothetical protein|eukprot:COSAG06_NODE_2268_length_7202_cov_2.299592_5_plen_74_part_00
MLLILNVYQKAWKGGCGVPYCSAKASAELCERAATALSSAPGTAARLCAQSAEILSRCAIEHEVATNPGAEAG